MANTNTTEFLGSIGISIALLGKYLDSFKIFNCNKGWQIGKVYQRNHLMLFQLFWLPICFVYNVFHRFMQEKVFDWRFRLKFNENIHFFKKKINVVFFCLVCKKNRLFHFLHSYKYFNIYHFGSVSMTENIFYDKRFYL